MNVEAILWQHARARSGRALPILSFPAARKLNATVEQLVKDPALQAEAMAYIAHRTDTLATVSPMDISVEAEAFGAEVLFSANEVPAVTGQLVGDADGAEALEVPVPGAGRTGVFLEAIRLAKEKITDKPVLAGMIGPFSLAGRLMAVTEILYSCYDEPETVHLVLEKATAFLIRYARALKEAGADGILMAEPLAGVLSPAMAKEFSVPYVKEIIGAVQAKDFAIVYHNCGDTVSCMLEDIFSQGAAAYHFGNAVDMEQVLAQAPKSCLCLGNIDPAGVLAEGTAEAVAEAARKLRKACDGYGNFLLSSGCDIPAHAPWENIEAFFDAARPQQP